MDAAPDSVMPFMKHFAAIPDHRVVGRTDHKLFDIVFIAVCGSIAACDDWETIRLWGQSKETWLRKYCALPHGIPSASTFRRFFRRVDADALQTAFHGWMEDMREALDGQSIAVDGKTARRSFSRADGKGAIHVVSAWMNANRMVLGQIKTGEKSNEITAIPELLNLLEIKNAIITIDAMGCQKSIAETIRKRGADYCLAVKENQPNLLEDVRSTFGKTPESSMLRHATREASHGRLEIRHYAQITDLSRIRLAQEWEGLESVVRVESHRVLPDGVATETRYYISSRGADVRRLAGAIRDHWGVENRPHYVLDVTFGEDGSRIRKGEGAENMAILRRLAMNFLNGENGRELKMSVRRRRMAAAFDDAALEKMLGLG